jgi:hypothetical protein
LVIIVISRLLIDGCFSDELLGGFSVAFNDEVVEYEAVEIPTSTRKYKREGR